MNIKPTSKEFEQKIKRLEKRDEIVRKEDNALTESEMLYWQVKDTGHGISKQNFDKIFDPFLPPRIQEEVQV